AGAFDWQDAATLSCTPAGAVGISAPNVVSWDNSTGGVFAFTVTGQTPGLYSLSANYGSFSDSGTSDGNAVYGITNISVSDGVTLTTGDQTTAMVTVSGYFPQQDSVNVFGGGNVGIGTPVMQSWDNTAGGTFAFTIDGLWAGGFPLTAVDTLFGTSSATTY